MEKNFESYQSCMEYEFKLRNKKNPVYSLRAYARDLGLTPSQLSEILSFKQGLSPSRALTVAQKMGLREQKITWFRSLVEAAHARSRQVRDEAQKIVSHFENGVETRTVLVETLPFDLKWYHIAIRRMTLMDDFQLDPQWISLKLGIQIEKAEQAIDDLLLSQLLEVDSDGKIKSLVNIRFNPDVKVSSVTDEIQKQMLFKAYQARTAIPPDRRRHAMHLLTIDKKLLPELKELIQEFEDKLDHLTYKSQTHDEVMVVGIQAFPLLKTQTSKTP